MRYASFFTGAMGLDLGLERAGWECAFANEVDAVACQTVRLNRPGLELFEADVRQLSPATFLATGAGGGLDLVAGGPPCQAFSTAGKRLGLNDDRGNAFLHFLDLAIALRPRFVLIENVRGLLSVPLRHRPHAQRGFGFPPLGPDELRGGAFEHVLGVLQGAGYRVSHGLYNTADFGVPQRRERLLVLASLGQNPLPSLLPTHRCPRSSDAAVRSLPPWTTFRSAVTGLGQHEHSSLRATQKDCLRSLKEGQNWRNLPSTKARAAMGRAYLCTGGRTGFLRRLAWDEPAPTLVTSPTMPATLLAHPAELRPLSVQEYLRLQGFPDDWKLAGTLSQKYRQVGNAVPVGFAEAVGRHLASVLVQEEVA